MQGIHRAIVSCVGLFLLGTQLSPVQPTRGDDATARRRPNILFVIADDQSWPHASAYGCAAVQTPHFDRVAREGVLFNNAFAPTPGCSPTRAAILTGRHHWQIENAGTHWSTFPTKYTVFPDALEDAGYFVGRTGKGWGPGSGQGWPHNPAGRGFKNFAAFLDERPDDKPFCYWFGSHDPHRPFTEGSGAQNGIDLDAIEVPGFMPDNAIVRSDIADYLFAIQKFDAQLGELLERLEQTGELDNTIIIVTSDNGMPFARAKANLYEYGVHVPLAIRWGDRAPGGRIVDDLVDLIDLTATIYEATGVEPPTDHPIAGRSLLSILASNKSGRVDPRRDAVFVGRERHGSARYNNWGYPSRAVRTHEFLYIRNFQPDRWPVGDPPIFGDIAPGPTGALIRGDDATRYAAFVERTTAKRPAEELYDLRDGKDIDNLHNLAADPAFMEVRKQLADRLEAHLKATGDPRVGDDPNIFETYRRTVNVRTFPVPDTTPHTNWGVLDVTAARHGANITIEAEHGNYVYGGYAVFRDREAALEWTVETDKPGRYRAEIRYALRDGDATLELTVNDESDAAQLTAAATGAWNRWATVETEITLKDATNTIRLTQPTGKAAQIDHIRLIARPQTP